MADIFISYARSDKARVAPLVAAIEAKGWSVWWDPAIAAGQQFDDQIDAELRQPVPCWWCGPRHPWLRAGCGARRAMPPSAAFWSRCDSKTLVCRSTYGRFKRPTSISGGRTRAAHRSRILLRSLRAVIERHRADQSVKATAESASSASAGRSSRRDLRPALRQHERRSGAGVLQRRHHRGHHHRPEQGFGTGGGFAQQRLYVQGQARRHSESSRANSRSATSWKAACARRAAGCGSPPSWSTVRATITSGPSATIAT